MNSNSLFGKIPIPTELTVIKAETRMLRTGWNVHISEGPELQTEPVNSGKEIRTRDGLKPGMKVYVRNQLSAWNSRLFWEFIIDIGGRLDDEPYLYGDSGSGQCASLKFVEKNPDLPAWIVSCFVNKSAIRRLQWVK